MTAEYSVPDWQLERYLLGELPVEVKERIEKALETDASVRERLEALRDSNRQILSSYPPGIMAERIEKRYRERGGKTRARAFFRPGLRRAALAFSFAALVLAVILPVRILLQENEEGGPDTGIRPKGLRSHLVIYVQSDGDVERLEHGAVLGEGDVIQISYVSEPGTYGVIYSIDGTGTVTLHFPLARQDTAPRLQGGGETPLPYAYQLDDAPFYERFFLITSDRPFSIAEVEEAVNELAANPRRAQRRAVKLPPGLRQYSTTLRKEEHQS